MRTTDDPTFLIMLFFGTICFCVWVVISSCLQYRADPCVEYVDGNVCETDVNGRSVMVEERVCLRWKPDAGK